VSSPLPDTAGTALERLLALMRRLRDPQQGCPWDRVQDFASIAPFTIEEAYEVADAIDRGDPQRLRDELGDLLFQVVFHARMAEERGWFDFAAVATAISDKLVRRHPHIFAEPATRAIADLHVAWEAQKAAERAEAGEEGALGAVPLALPALTRAAKLGRRASRVGFDWSDAAGVRAKIDEELGEIDRELGGAADVEAVAGEIGDLLFTVANWARHLAVDPEDALRRASVKFERRFAAMERLARARGLAFGALTPGEWETLWSEIKRNEAG
jgi:ATP diphosphatase